MDKLKERRTDLSEGLTLLKVVKPGYLVGFRAVWITLAAFFAVNLMVFGIIAASPTNLYSLALTPEQPAGILTANFMHIDIAHLASNLLLFAIMIVFFVGVNTFSDAKKRRRLSRIFALGSLSAGIVANTVLLVSWKLSGASGIGAVGASGIVYGAMGIAFVSALYNLPGHLRRTRTTLHPKNVCTEWRGTSCVMWKEVPGTANPGRLFFVFFFSLFTVLSFAFMVTFQANSFFLNVPGVAWLSHASGFVFGLLAAALAIIALLTIESWNRCGCLFCCIPKEGRVCDETGGNADTPFCRTS